MKKTELCRASVSVNARALTETEIDRQMEIDYEESLMWEDEDDFQCCDNCDLPDACADFGCAIKQWLRKGEEW